MDNSKNFFNSKNSFHFFYFIFKGACYRDRRAKDSKKKEKIEEKKPKAFMGLSLIEGK